MLNFIKENLKLFILAFFLGYLFASWAILGVGGISPYKLEDIINLNNNPNPKERKLMIIHALNPFEPMNPAFYFFYFPKQK